MLVPPAQVAMQQLGAPEEFGPLPKLVQPVPPEELANNCISDVLVLSAQATRQQLAAPEERWPTPRLAQPAPPDELADQCITNVLVHLAQAQQLPDTASALDATAESMELE